MHLLNQLKCQSIKALKYLNILLCLQVLKIIHNKGKCKAVPQKN